MAGSTSSSATRGTRPRPGTSTTSASPATTATATAPRARAEQEGRARCLSGGSWYEAPSWDKHDIRQPGDYGDGLRSYSECMTCWADDLNRDGWPAQIATRFPGQAA